MTDEKSKRFRQLLAIWLVKWCQHRCRYSYLSRRVNQSESEKLLSYGKIYKLTVVFRGVDSYLPRFTSSHGQNVRLVSQRKTIVNLLNLPRRINQSECEKLPSCGNNILTAAWIEMCARSTFVNMSRSTIKNNILTYPPIPFLGLYRGLWVLGPYSQGRPTFRGVETRARQCKQTHVSRQAILPMVFQVFHKIFVGSSTDQNARFIGLMRLHGKHYTTQ